MNKLIINHDYTQLQTEDENLNNFLYSQLRFQEKGAYFHPLFKKGLWDGYREFYNRKTGRFLTGLLPEVRFVLKAKQIKCDVIDNRTPFQFGINKIDDSFLNNNKPKKIENQQITLHDYQVDLVNRALKLKRGIIKAPTSAGKSFVFVSLFRCLKPGGKYLFVTKGSSLAQQNYQELCDWGVPGVGRFFGSQSTRKIDRITCINTNAQNAQKIKKLFPTIDGIIVDEIHACMSNSAVNIYKACKNASLRIAISATPFRFTKKNRKGQEVCADKVQKYKTKGFFGPVIKTGTTKSGYLETKDLQKRGILAPSECTFFRVKKPDDIVYLPYADAVTLGISENEYLQKTVRDLSLSLSGRTLILVERISQGERLNSLIPGSVFVQGKNEIQTRLAAFQELKYSSDNFIAVVMRHIISEGINVFVHNLINASGGKAEHNIVQQLGRGLRSAEDKTHLNFYDFLFETNDYLLDHSKNRIEVLTNEGHKVRISPPFKKP